MTRSAQRRGARGLLVVLLLLVAVVVTADLARSDSWLRSSWSDLFGPRSTLRRFLDGLRAGGAGWRR